MISYFFIQKNFFSLYSSSFFQIKRSGVFNVKVYFTYSLCLKYSKCWLLARRVPWITQHAVEAQWALRCVNAPSVHCVCKHKYYVLECFRDCFVMAAQSKKANKLTENETTVSLHCHRQQECRQPWDSAARRWREIMICRSATTTLDKIDLCFHSINCTLSYRALAPLQSPTSVPGLMAHQMCHAESTWAGRSNTALYGQGKIWCNTVFESW